LSSIDPLGCAQDAPCRRLQSSAKVIMVTGANDFESVEKAMALGAVDYITKPFTVEYLEETVDSKIATHLMYA
jgi:response regulator of citrate/malate metabolism